MNRAHRLVYALTERSLPSFKRKVVLFLGDGSKLVITRGGNSYFFAGALRGRADDLRELDLMLRDPISDRGGISRAWVDPEQ
jgi:hypothetical protein